MEFIMKKLTAYDLEKTRLEILDTISDGDAFEVDWLGNKGAPGPSVRFLI